MGDRPLTERESEILSFLLTAPGIPDVDILRRQAAMTTGSSCDCGCASLELTVDRSAAPHASSVLRRDLAWAETEDIASVHRLEPLRFYGEDGNTIDPQHHVTAHDLDGYIGLILWTTGDGWLDWIEMHLVGNFARPSTFPPAELFEAPQLCSGPPAWGSGGELP
jgi:hypothetical protein